ncbi:MAG: IS21-like element helper ATPase IstB [Gammaproteobacteria bacterium]
MLEHTKQKMASLRLNGMLLALEEQGTQLTSPLSFEERLALLIEREYSHRENQRLSNRLKQAKLKPTCSVESIDFQHARGLHKQQLLSLASDTWIKQHRTIMITGPTGTGKTFFACALAHKACLLGFTSRYYRLLHLMHDVVIAYRESKLQRYLTQISKIDVLIIDDFGMNALDEEQKRLLLEILEQRYETRSTIITSQLPVGQWYEYLNDPIIADALLDRIVHQAENISLQGESMRKTRQKLITCHEEEIKS